MVGVFNQEYLISHHGGCPTATKNDKLRRTDDAWALLDHDRAAVGHKANGITNALDGTADAFRSCGVLCWWRELGMPARRGGSS